ncbi:MAG TPA: TonB-dependent receptor [Acidobacteriaceae bacterium]|nr:TonB-dependent receptor [Acidobacteriaceae bacterium]
MSYESLKRYCLVLLLCVTVSIAASAQSTSQGSIAGTVFDTTGAVIPGATVIIHNTGTNADITLTSDDSGYYKAPLLEPGVYTVTVKATNFSNYRATDVVVQTSQTTELEPKLTAGSTGTVVEVTAGAPIINTEAPDFSSNLNQHSIQDIPINIRRWSALALTTPGVVSDTSGFGLVSVRGQSTLLNNVLIDGADDNDAYWSEERGRTREAYSTSENAVREFAVNTGVYSAEFGRATGAVINSVTKSGTNQFHGQIYFYDRQSSWGAYNDYTVILGKHVKPEDLRKIYGGTVSGPIIKDKLFFMYTYDQHTRINPFIGFPTTPSTYIPTLDAPTAPGADTVTVGPTTYTCNLTTGYLAPNSGTTAAPVGDAMACTLAARLGLGSYSAGYTSFNSDLTGLQSDYGQVARAGYQEINTPKIDWQINSRNHASFLYHRLNWDAPGDVQTGTSGQYGLDSEGNDFVHVQYGMSKLTTLITSNISNEILYQYSRELLAETQQAFSSYESTNFASATGNIPFVQKLGGTSNNINLGSPYYAYRLALPDERKWQVADTLYWNHGNHTVKFGVDLLHNSDLQNSLSTSGSVGTTLNASANGTYYYQYLGNLFADIATRGHAGTCNTTGLQTGTATTSAVGTSACYAGYLQAFGNAAYSITTLDWAAFVQDNWKFSPQLTLELGVRYDYEKLPAESAALYNQFIPQTNNDPSDKANIGPRAGFAYDVYGTGKTILRGGIGIYYGRILNGTILAARQNSGVTSGSLFTFGAPFTPTSVGAPTFPNNLTSATAPGVIPSAYYLDQNLRNPSAYEYDLVLQQDLGHHNILSFSYLGSNGRHLPNFLDVNLNPATMATATITVNPGGPLTAGTYQIPQYTSVINPAYLNITDVVSNVNQSYNAFVAEIQNRSLKLVQFDFNYTWSHALDYAQSVNTSTSVETWQDPYNNPRLNYGNSDFNVPDRFTGYVLFNVPNYARTGSLLGYVINGWSIDNNFQMQSGIPYSANLGATLTTQENATLAGSNLYGSGGPTWIPNSIPGGGRNRFEQPRDIVDDAHVQKAFNFTDRYNLQVFANVFNVANHQNVTLVGTAAYYVNTANKANAATTATLNYLTPAAAQALGATAFGATANTNSEGFLYTQRLIEIGAKLNF